MHYSILHRKDANDGPKGKVLKLMEVKRTYGFAGIRGPMSVPYSAYMSQGVGSSGSLYSNNRVK